MNSVLAIVLTSSVVSAVMSALFAEITRRGTEKALRNEVAQATARALEEYVRQCEWAILDISDALMLAKDHGDQNIDSVELPNFSLPSSVGFHRLEAVWKDRVGGFPERIKSRERYLKNQFRLTEDSLDYYQRAQVALANVGLEAFELAVELRSSHALPLQHAKDECDSALKCFKSIREEQSAQG